LEILRREPLVLVDGAHNYEGARSLRRALEDYFPNRDVVMVFGMLEDKERAKIAAELAPAARAVVVTRPDSPRAGDWRELAVHVRRHTPEVYLMEDIEDALNKAFSLVRPGEMVCVTGSLYMVAEARQLLLNMGGGNNVL
jgi:dihydrofolate synthase/folylpolyglutamate synthase